MKVSLDFQGRNEIDCKKKNCANNSKDLTSNNYELYCPIFMSIGIAWESQLEPFCFLNYYSKQNVA